MHNYLFSEIVISWVGGRENQIEVYVSNNEWIDF